MSKESHDQKRKRKLEERKRKARQVESLAYLGEKYKTEDLIPSLMHAEIGIYQTYVLTDRKIFDQTAKSALERLIKQMRSGPLPPLPETTEIRYDDGGEEDLLIDNIRRSWSDHFATEWKPPKDDLIGVLRTILGSIERVKESGPQSQAYLRHIAGFLTSKLGVKVKKVAVDSTSLPEPKEDEPELLEREQNADGQQAT